MLGRPWRSIGHQRTHLVVEGCHLGVHDLPQHHALARLQRRQLRDVAVQRLRSRRGTHGAQRASIRLGCRRQQQQEQRQSWSGGYGRSSCCPRHAPAVDGVPGCPTMRRALRAHTRTHLDQAHVGQYGLLAAGRSCCGDWRLERRQWRRCWSAALLAAAARRRQQQQRGTLLPAASRRRQRCWCWQAAARLPAASRRRLADCWCWQTAGCPQLDLPQFQGTTAIRRLAAGELHGCSPLWLRQALAACRAGRAL